MSKQPALGPVPADFADNIRLFLTNGAHADAPPPSEN